jgi:(E)-4-hydroxy-3-methylbut-2-enyl-diphosphate synthase
MSRIVQLKCRDITIGGGAPVSIQSMLNVKTEDSAACIRQIRELEDAGCDIVRLAVPTAEAVASFAEIRKQTDMPLVADIHFDYRLAIGAIEAGADKVRINPGNIGSEEKVRAVVEKASERKIPIRVGVNSGSLEKDILKRDGRVTAKGLAESAIRNVKILEDMGFYDIVISAKSSDLQMNIEAYKHIAEHMERTGMIYPLHVGVTEAGNKESGIIKSAIGIGHLLLEGIGDTIRVSLTGDPVQEVIAARKILSSLRMRREALNMVSCPTCGRTRVDLEKILSAVERSLMPAAEKRMSEGKEPLTVAVMGCEVNGPGEAAEADFGVACGDGRGALFRKGQIVKTVKEEDIERELLRMVEDEDI